MSALRFNLASLDAGQRAMVHGLIRVLQLLPYRPVRVPLPHSNWYAQVLEIVPGTSDNLVGWTMDPDNFRFPVSAIATLPELVRLGWLETCDHWFDGYGEVIQPMPWKVHAEDPDDEALPTTFVIPSVAAILAFGAAAEAQGDAS